MEQTVSLPDDGKLTPSSVELRLHMKRVLHAKTASVGFFWFRLLCWILLFFTWILRFFFIVRPPDSFWCLRDISHSDIQQPFRLALASLCERSGDTKPLSKVLWRDGGNEMLLNIQEVRLELGKQFVVAVLPVYTDQSGESEVIVPFVTRPEKNALGFMAGTESVPRGPHEVIDAFGDSLVALSWAAIVKTILAWSNAAGGKEMQPIGFTATRDKLRINAIKFNENGEP